MRHSSTAALVVGVLAFSAASPAGADSAHLTEARRLYNLGRYEAAIGEAEQARLDPTVQHQALLLLGRARLERFRQTAQAADLTGAREALRGVDASRLESRDRLEFVVGLGEALYLDDEYGAAADVLDGAVAQASELGAGARDQLLDWWATATDRHAQSRPPAERPAMYDRIRTQMYDELRRDSSSGAASYWLAAAARAKGDIEGAWEAAMAGWVRAQLTRDRGAALRPDLDRLVLHGIIPERARRLSSLGGDLEQTIAGMASEWEVFKEKWTNR